MKQILSFVFVIGTLTSFAQDDNIVYDTFADVRLINAQTNEVNKKGELSYIISHRFGDMFNPGDPTYFIDNFFGMDGGATMYFELAYGLTDHFMFGAGRTNFRKSYVGYLKYNLLQQKTDGLPFSLSAYSDITLSTYKGVPALDTFFVDRFNYTYQLIFSSKISDQVSVMLVPSMIHRNYVDDNTISNDVFAGIVGVRYRLTPVIAITGEYVYVSPTQAGTNKDQSIVLGMEAVTKGHIFQFTVGNSNQIVPQYYIGNTEGFITEPMDGGGNDVNLRIGFHIVRMFQLGGRQY